MILLILCFYRKKKTKIQNFKRRLNFTRARPISIDCRPNEEAPVRHISDVPVYRPSEDDTEIEETHLIVTNNMYVLKTFHTTFYELYFYFLIEIKTNCTQVVMRKTLSHLGTFLA